MNRKWESKRVSVARAKAAAKYADMVTAAPSPHAFVSPSGATAPAVKTHDPQTRAMIEAFLKEREGRTAP